MSEYYLAVFKLNSELCVRQCLSYCTLQLKYILLRQRRFLLIIVSIQKFSQNTFNFPVCRYALHDCFSRCKVDQLFLLRLLDLSAFAIHYESESSVERRYYKKTVFVTPRLSFYDLSDTVFHIITSFSPQLK